MFYILLWVLATLIIFHVTTRYNRKARIMSKIPGPTAYPIFGNTLRFNVSCPNEFWNRGRAITKQYYPITRFWLFTTAVASIRHPDDVAILLSNQNAITKGHLYEYLHPWLKAGLLTNTGNKWRQRRKILTPAFHFNILKKYLEVTNEEVEKCIKTLKSESKEIIKNVVSFSSKYSLNIICESAMGVSLDKTDTKTVNDYTKAVHDMGQLIIYRMPRPYISNWMLPYLYQWGTIFTNSLKVLHGFTKQVINDRREYHKLNKNKYLEEINDEVEEKEIGKKKRLAMLDLLLAAEKTGAIDADGIQEEVDTFLFEGHDTSGMCLSYTLMLLAENKDSQDRARTEITELMDRTNGKLDIADLQELNYLERCIKESLRLYPPVATLERYVDTDIQLKHALIPADTHLLIHLYDLHRDPKFWTDPDKFDPDRFLPENSCDRHPFAYVPFSAGSRNCIGQKFAMMELKSFIARLLYNFYVEPINKISDIRLIADIIIRPKDPFYIKLVRIDN